MADEVNPQRQPASRKRRFVRILEWIFGVVAIFYVALTIGSGVLAWRLSNGPWNAQAILPAVQWLMSHSERLQFKIGSLVVSWPDRHKPLALEMKNIQLEGPRGEFLSIETANLGLSPWRLLLADFRFSYAEVQNLSLRVIRLPDGAITLTGADKSAGADKASSVALRLNNIAADLPSIDHLRFANMRVIFEDQKDAMIRRFDNVNAEILQDQTFGGNSVSGSLTGTLSGADDGSLAAVDFVYNADDETLSATAQLEKADTRQLLGGILRAANLPLIDMLVKGRAELRLKNDFSLDSLALHLQGDDGALYWPRNYGQGLENQKLTKFDLNVNFEPGTQILKIENAAITIKGITLAITGALTADATWDTLTGDLQLNIPVLAVDALPAVWPKIWDSGGRQWLVDRMDKGRFAHINVNMPLTASREIIIPVDADLEIAADQAEATPEIETQWHIKPGTIKGTFDFTGVTVDYRHPLLPATGTTGTGIYEGMGLTLDINHARIGGLDVTKGSLYFDDLITPGKGDAVLHFDMKGSVASVFDYLDKEPISYRKKVSLDASNAKGSADVGVDIKFPTLHDMSVDDVHVLAHAKLSNLIVPGAIKGLTLAGGPYDLIASENHFKLSGSGAIEGQPATLTWQEMFATRPTDEFASKLEAHIDTNKPIRQKFIGSLEDRIDGIIPADISMITKPNGHGDLSLKADLKDASIDFTNPFNAIKNKGSAANVKLTGTLQDGFIQSIDALSITGSDIALASGSIGFGRDAKNEPVLAKAVLKGLRLGSNDADIDATWKDEISLTANVTGASFDARDIMGGSDAHPDKPKTATGYDVTLKLDQMWLGTIPLEKVTGSFVGNTGGTIQVASLDATAGGAPVTLRYSGTGGEGDRLILEADDAGAGLSALGITDRVRGGTLRIEGKPLEKGNPGDMKGKLVLKDFSAIKAPVLAKLINLLSLPGILNILNQDTGLTFQRLEATMTLLNKKGGPLISFKDGRTTGSSLGLTFEGSIDMAAGTTDIQGTVIPMSEVNSLVSKIPLVGDILTGGNKGAGIFAATYSVKGPSADPDVRINPLSVLTPGILRRILFEGALTGGSK